jgi:hypothetical protein
MSPCISMACFINGSLSDFFGSFYGLCQRDPLSPLLFVIVMEAFSMMLSRAMASGYLPGFWVDIQNKAPWKYPTLLQMGTFIMCDI